VQGERGQVQGDQRRLRVSEGPAEARRLRPLRPCRVPERWPGRASGRRLRRSRRHLRDDLRQRLRRRRGASAPAARRGLALRHAGRPRRSLPRQGKRDPGRGLGRLRALRRKRRFARHGQAHLQPVRRPRQDPRAARLLRDREAVPQLQWLGSGHRKPVPGMSRRGPCRSGAEAHRRSPAGRGYRHPYSARRQGRSGAARRSPRRSLHLHPRPPAPGVRARGNHAVHARADQLHHCRAGRLRRDSRA
jgi:hypothetical protein